MPDFSTLLQQGATNAWLFIPSAILLGALHGLEPGHSKTMMAAFIVAIRGTVSQAIMLGVAATVSHTAVVWAVVLVGMHFGSRWNAEATEPYFQVASAVMMVTIALWMMWRTWRQQSSCLHSHDDHTHEDPHALAHANDIQRRFTHREVTNGQILMFGLTGGLVPCPAAITTLLLCLQLKKITLGATLVVCFSIGLALTLVLSGVVAALSVRHVSKRWSGLGELAHKAPYFSGGLILLLGLYIGYQGFERLLTL
jgi:nickel/cobalt transporter (NicO) family protein